MWSSKVKFAFTKNPWVSKHWTHIGTIMDELLFDHKWGRCDDLIRLFRVNNDCVIIGTLAFFKWLKSAFKIRLSDRSNWGKLLKQWNETTTKVIRLQRPTYKIWVLCSDFNCTWNWLKDLRVVHYIMTRRYAWKLPIFFCLNSNIISDINSL